MRAVATKSARPVLASQAEKASSNMGVAENPVDSNCKAHRASAINRDNIIPSKHRSAERRWVRWNVSPISPNKKAELKLKCVGVIRGSWGLTAIF